MNDQILLTFPIRAFSQNSFWSSGKGRRFITKKGRIWRQSIIDHFEAEYFHLKGFFNTNHRIKIDFRFYFKGKRTRDAFNYEKPLTDSLEGLLLPNDEQIDIGSVTRMYHAQRDGIAIFIQPITKIPYHPVDDLFMN